MDDIFEIIGGIVKKYYTAKTAVEPHPIRMVVAIIVAAVVGAHLIHYGGVNIENGIKGRHFFFTHWLIFIWYCMISLAFTILCVRLIMCKVLGFRTAPQYFIGGTICGSIVALTVVTSSIESSLMIGVAVTINSWLFYLIVFWKSGETEELDESIGELDLVSLDLVMAEEAFAAGRYKKAIEKFEIAVSQAALEERHMVMYQQAKRYSRDK